MEAVPPLCTAIGSAHRRTPSGRIPSERRAKNWFRPAKPDIPQDLRDFLEQAGAEKVRTLLYNGWVNPDGLTDAQKRIRVQSEERTGAVASLDRKTAVDALWIKIGVVAAVLAAIFAFLAVVK
jgi:hypothetical protein